MKNITFTLVFISLYSTAYCCSFIASPFCNSINETNPDNVILRGYFSDSFQNGLTFTRLETLRGNEERDQIKVWDHLPFDCNGEHLRNATQMGNINQEIIISLPHVDSIFFGNEVFEDYRVPEGLWWETHSLLIEGDSIFGFLFQSQEGNPTVESIHFDDFIVDILDESQCVTTTTVETNEDHVKIFPTVVNDFVYIEYNTEIENSDVYLYSVNGSQKFSKPLSSKIHLGILEKGMYIIVIQTPENKCYHEKLIKI